MNSLAELFAKLPASDSRTYRAETVIASAPIYLARVGAAPVLLIEQREPSATAPFALRHVRATFNVPCRIRIAESTKAGDFAVVECVDADEGLSQQFLGICQSLVDLKPKAEDLPGWLATLAELLRSIESPSTRSVFGAFGELLLIEAATDPDAMVHAWHDQDRERFDFARDVERIEVKTCSRGPRRHHFALAQVVDPGLRIFVASIMVETVGAGTTMVELADMIRPRLALKPRLKFERVLLTTLGRDWHLAGEQRFDLKLARESLRLIDASGVPRVGDKLPPEVSDVRFTSDVTDVTPIPGGLTRWGLPSRGVAGRP